jgi:DNA-binding MarR family transcriptional regulator
MITPFVPTLKEWVKVFMGHSMRAFFAYAKENGISMSQFGALGHISKGAGGVSDIGEDIGITSAAASQMLERLVQQGLILRSEDPHDRRVKQIVLTEKGKQLLEGSWQVRQSWFEDLVGMLSRDEQEKVTVALTILIEKVNQLEQQPEL